MFSTKHLSIDIPSRHSWAQYVRAVIACCKRPMSTSFKVVDLSPFLKCFSLGHGHVVLYCFTLCLGVFVLLVLVIQFCCSSSLSDVHVPNLYLHIDEHIKNEWMNLQFSLSFLRRLQTSLSLYYILLKMSISSLTYVGNISGPMPLPCTTPLLNSAGLHATK